MRADFTTCDYYIGKKKRLQTKVATSIYEESNN